MRHRRDGLLSLIAIRSGASYAWEWSARVKGNHWTAILIIGWVGKLVGVVA